MDATCDSMEKVKMESGNWCFPEKEPGHTTQMVGAKLTKCIPEVSDLLLSGGCFIKPLLVHT